MASLGLPRPDVGSHAARHGPSPLSDLERAILLTALYADLFDYPLTEDELYQRLVCVASHRAAFERALRTLVGPYLVATGGYLVWIGREHLVAVRDHRRQAAPRLWASAQRYGRWLARVPFVRMVAVSGSLAVHNAEDNSDIDLFCITTPNRLWLARTFIVPLSKLTRRLPRLFPLILCPNYILTLSALDVEDRNLFTAHEVAQAVPLWGGEVYDCFLQTNRWMHDFLPHTRLEDHSHEMHKPAHSWVTRWAESLLRGWLGDTLDRLMHRLFVTFYRKRAERVGWPWPRLAPAYQRNRYTVPEGGYTRAIHRLFVQRIHERLNGQIPPGTLERLFVFSDEEATPTVYDWEGLFAEDYGVHKT